MRAYQNPSNDYDSRSWVTIRRPLKCGLRLINIKDSLTANFFADFSALDIEKLQENGRGIFAIPRVAEFIVILIC